MKIALYRSKHCSEFVSRVSEETEKSPGYTRLSEIVEVDLPLLASEVTKARERMELEEEIKATMKKMSELLQRKNEMLVGL